MYLYPLESLPPPRGTVRVWCRACCDIHLAPSGCSSTVRATRMQWVDVGSIPTDCVTLFPVIAVRTQSQDNVVQGQDSQPPLWTQH